ncbi:hypothetical protein O988_06203 [Pseudogymnoascus sp. VKM F-3808]|nr:hypothetical protein O988_06203 [Pseudogymnoascus sp. VKM F-3808]
MPDILPRQMRKDVRNHYVYSASKNKSCPCGWYIYYSSICTHVYKEYKHVCGGKTTRSGKSAFCRSPAPRNIVKGTQVSASCRHCSKASAGPVPLDSGTRPEGPTTSSTSVRTDSQLDPEATPSQTINPVSLGDSSLENAPSLEGHSLENTVVS